MTTTLKSNERVFLLASKDAYAFCNLRDIQEVIRRTFKQYERFTVKHYWDGKFVICSKQYLNEMFEANQIDFRIRKFEA